MRTKKIFIVNNFFVSEPTESDETSIFLLATILFRLKNKFRSAEVTALCL